MHTESVVTTAGGQPLHVSRLSVFLKEVKGSAGDTSQHTSCVGYLRAQWFTNYHILKFFGPYVVLVCMCSFWTAPVSVNSPCFSVHLV